MVHVHPEAQGFRVELLCTVHVRDGDNNNLELENHAIASLMVPSGRRFIWTSLLIHQSLYSRTRNVNRVNIDTKRPEAVNPAIINFAHDRNRRHHTSFRLQEITPF